MLFKDIISEGNGFLDYNIRSFIIRRAREDFRAQRKLEETNGIE